MAGGMCGRGWGHAWPGGMNDRGGGMYGRGMRGRGVCMKFLTHACENITFPQLRKQIIHS